MRRGSAILATSTLPARGRNAVRDPHRPPGDAVSSFGGFRERFQREARAVAAPQHPNICTVCDIGETEDHQHFIVMELLEGETLHHRVGRGPFDIEQIVDLGTALADALDVAHGHGLIHRDIKPANIVLTPRGLKILDCGLAKSVATSAVSARTPSARVGDDAVGQRRDSPDRGRRSLFLA